MGVLKRRSFCCGAVNCGGGRNQIAIGDLALAIAVDDKVLVAAAFAGGDSPLGKAADCSSIVRAVAPAVRIAS